MLTLSRKADYALISLAHMAQRADQVCSAREIAASHNLPLPLLMNILKTLHSHGFLTSRRGSHGGYQIAVNIHETSLCELIAVVECPGHGDCFCLERAGQELQMSRRSMYWPVQALQYKLQRFLKEVKLSDLILPGRRIDVPLERVQFNTNLEKITI